MNKKIFCWKWIVAFIAVLFLTKCKIPYDPAVKSSKNHFLVVEGYINTNGVTNIKLTRTRNVTWGDTAAYINETNASVSIEDNTNNVYPLNENGAGNYSADYFLNSNSQYRIHIVTADQNEYLSAFVDGKQSPPIDKV